MTKFVKKCITIFLLFALVITSFNVTPLEAKAASKIAVSSITLKNATTGKLTIIKGKTYKLGATVAPSDASNKKLTYKSSNSDIVKVSSSGKLTAKGTGKATITVTSKANKKKKTKVVVNVVEKKKFKKITKLSASVSQAEIKVGETAKVTPTFKPSKASNKNITYKSNNTSVATVDQKGTVTGVGEGKVSITVSSLDGSKKSATIDITIKPIEVDVTGITLSTTSISLVEGNSQQLTATVSPDNATHKDVTYSSSNNSVATVDGSGNIKAIQAGNATITSTAGSKSATCEVTVTAANQNNSFTVSFETNGGSTIASQTVNNGQTVTCPSNPLRSTYVFAGWYEDSAFSSAFDFNRAILNNTTLYAKWDPVTVSLSIQNPNNTETSEISQTITGEVSTNGTIANISYENTSTSDSNTSNSGQAMISENTWSIDNVKLMPEENTFTITAVTVDGVSTSQTFNITYDSGYTYTPNQSNVQILSTTASEVTSNAVSANTIDSKDTSVTADTSNVSNDAAATETNTSEESKNNDDSTAVSLEDNAEDTSDSEDSNTADSNADDSNTEESKGTTSDQTGEIPSTDSTDQAGALTQNIDDTTSSEALLGYVDNIVLVYFNEDVNEEAKDNFVTLIGGTKVGYLNTINQYQIQLSSSKTLDELNTYCATLMSNNSIIKYACPDMVISEDFPIEEAVPSDPWSGGDDWNEASPSGSNWWQEAIDAPSAWEYSDTFSRIKVGIVDNGFATSHSDLAISFPDSTSASENNAENHGTHVAGIIGATANNNTGITGVNWNVNMVGYDWHPANGQSWSTESKIYEGLVKTVESGAKVVNFSLGKTASLASDSSTFSSSYYNNWGKTTSVVMESLLARDFDFVVVQSAGNGAANGRGVDAIYNGFFASVTSDNCYSSSDVTKDDILDRIIIVAAAEQSGSGYQVTSFSNGGDQVSIAAPGRTIYSTIANGGYGYMSGTSMASPIVAGVASLVWSVNSDFTGSEVKEILCNNTDVTAGDNTTSTKTGGSYAMVNTNLAVQEARSRGGIVKAYFSDAATGSRIAANYKIHKDTADGELFDGNTYSSDGDGNFTLSGLPAGTYVLEITLAGYVTNYFTINVPIRGEVDLGTISVSKTLSENEYRIVLTWGLNPEDLDSHLRATNLANEDVHVYYSNKVEDEANLDVDDVTSYGPETVTVTDFTNLNGFKYAVHNYTDREADSSSSDAINLANSEAVVKIYKGSNLIKTYNVPTNQKGTVWTVFAIDNSGNISDINAVSYEPYSALVLYNTNGVNSLNGIPADTSTGIENLSLEELNPPKN